MLKQYDLSGAQIVVCLKLFGCPEVTAEFTLDTAETLAAYLNFGRTSGDFCQPLIDRAPDDYDANMQAREKARDLLRTTVASRLPRDHKSMMIGGITALFFWLVLHDCQRGDVLINAMVQSLCAYKNATFTIGCSERRAYVITVGNTIADITTDLQIADQTTHSSPTIH